MKWSEGAFRPFIKAPFNGPFSGQPEHNESLGKKKEEESKGPNRDGTKSRRSRQRKPPQAYYGADVKKDEVPEAELSLQVGGHAGIMSYINYCKLQIAKCKFKILGLGRWGEGAQDAIDEH